MKSHLKPILMAVAQSYCCARSHVYYLSVALSSYYSPVPCNVVPYLCLLLGSWCLYQRGPILRRPLVSGTSLYRLNTLSHYMEHCVELSCHYLLVFMGRRSPKHSMPKDTKGKRLDRKVYMESAVVVCRTSSSTVHLRIACARVCASLGD